MAGHVTKAETRGHGSPREPKPSAADIPVVPQIRGMARVDRLPPITSRIKAKLTERDHGIQHSSCFRQRDFAIAIASGSIARRHTEGIWHRVGSRAWSGM